MRKLFLAIVVQLPTDEECSELGARLIEEIRPHVGSEAEAVFGVGDAALPVQIISGIYEETL